MADYFWRLPVENASRNIVTNFTEAAVEKEGMSRVATNMYTFYAMKNLELKVAVPI